MCPGSAFKCCNLFSVLIEIILNTNKLLHFKNQKVYELL